MNSLWTTKTITSNGVLDILKIQSITTSDGHRSPAARFCATRTHSCAGSFLCRFIPMWVHTCHHRCRWPVIHDTGFCKPTGAFITINRLHIWYPCYLSSGKQAASWMSSWLTKPAVVQLFRHITARVDSTAKQLRTWERIRRPLLKTRSTSTEVANYMISNMTIRWKLNLPGTDR